MTNYPEDNQTGVALNKALVYTFQDDMDPDSIFSGSVTLYETETGQVVDGSYSYENKTVTYIPSTSLNPFTSYVWYFTGADTQDALPLDLADGTPFLESVSIGFQTGDVVVSSISKDEYATSYIEELDTIDDGQTEDQRDADVFRVLKTTPELYESFVDVTTPTITIEFSSPVKPGQDLNSLLTLSYAPLLRETYYFKDGLFNPSSIRRIPGYTGPIQGTERYQMPTGTSTLSTDGLTLTWTKTEDWNANAYVKVLVSKELLNTDDVKLNNSQDEEFYFLTDIFPLFTTVESVLLPLSSVPGFVSEEIVLKNILKASLDAWHLANKAFYIGTPHRAAIKFTEAATQLGLIDMKSIVNELNRGKSINLADLSVNHNYPRNPEASVTTVRSEAAQALFEAKKEISLLANNYDFKVGERGRNTGIVHDVYRNRLSTNKDLGFKSQINGI